METEIRSFNIGDNRVLKFLERIPSRGVWGETHKGNWSSVLTKPDEEMAKSGIEYFPNVRIVVEKDGQIIGLCMAETRRFSDFFELWDGKAKEGECAWIEGICAMFDEKKCMTDLLNSLFGELRDRGIKNAQYPGPLEMGNPLTRLSTNDLSAQAFFRENGFRLMDMHYVMSLDLSKYDYPHSLGEVEHKLHGEGIDFMLLDRGFAAYKEGKEIGNLKWAGGPIVNLGMEVHSTFRNKGIGTVLMAKSLSQMRIDGISIVRLDVHADNVPALKLYGKYQFKIEKTYLYMLKNLGQ